MSDAADDSLTKYVVSGVSVAFVATFGFLVRFVFGNVFKQLGDLKHEIQTSNDGQFAKIADVAKGVEKLADSAAEGRTRSAITELRLGHLEASHANLQLKYDDIAGFLAREQNYKKRGGSKTPDDEP